MRIYEIMTITNNLLEKGIEKINKAECELLFKHSADEKLREVLEDFGWTITDDFEASPTVDEPFRESDIAFMKDNSNIEIL